MSSFSGISSPPTRLADSPGFDVESSYSSSAISTSFTNFYSYTGSGVLRGFKIDVSNQQVEVRIVIDGNVAMTEDLNNLRNFLFSDFDAGSVPNYINFPTFGVMEFFPTNGIFFESSIELQLRNVSNFTINLEKYIVFADKR